MVEMQMLQWHPAFYAGIQVEFAHIREDLYLENEHQLGTKPKEVDVLIMKKEADTIINNNIGQIFRKYNLIEYKSPNDYFSIDDFYKVYGYACFYKSDTESVNQISVHEITLSFMCSRFPKALIKHLKEERDFEIIKQEPGIYYVRGDVFPIQLVILPQLTEKNFWLKYLTNKISDVEVAKRLLTEYEKYKGNKLYESLMNIIVHANWKVFEEVRKMCQALEELMKEELDAREQRGWEQGMEQGIEQMVFSLVRRGLLAIQIAADELGISVSEVQERLGTQ